MDYMIISIIAIIFLFGVGKIISNALNSFESIQKEIYRGLINELRKHRKITVDELEFSEDELEKVWLT
jgi:hypothetical protein